MYLDCSVFSVMRGTVLSYIFPGKRAYLGQAEFGLWDTCSKVQGRIWQSVKQPPTLQDCFII